MRRRGPRAVMRRRFPDPISEPEARASAGAANGARGPGPPAASSSRSRLIAPDQPGAFPASSGASRASRTSPPVGRPRSSGASAEVMRRGRLGQPKFRGACAGLPMGRVLERLGCPVFRSVRGQGAFSISITQIEILRDCSRVSVSCSCRWSSIRFSGRAPEGESLHSRSFPSQKTR